MTQYDHYLDGAPFQGESDRFGDVFDPARGVAKSQVRLATTGDVDAVVASSLKAFQTWSETSVTARSRIMFDFRQLLVEHEDELAAIISSEHGKTIDDAKGEVVRGREVVEFAAGIPQLLKGEYSDSVSGSVDSHTFRQPIGVVAGITPFNFPIMVPLWMHPVAIATGNTFILKPSERVPGASDLVARLYTKAGLPDGVFNVVHGDKVAVDAILEHRDIAGVSFVGSTPIAKYVHENATRTGKRVQALGGAKNHAVVMPDANLDFAADHIVAAGYGSAGQRCMAISAVVAVGPVADTLVEKIRERSTDLKVSVGTDPDAEMGPVVTKASRDRIVDYIGQGEAAGATVVVDGRDLVVDEYEEGFFVGPSLLDQVTPDMSVYTDEIFGPVLTVLRVPTLDAAIELINSNPYGNGTAVFTSSGEVARTFQRKVHVGMIGINVPVPVPMAFHSFGGWKDSLFGDHHIHGPEGVRFYTQAKVVTTRWPHVSEESLAQLNFPTAH
ncbi:MULTISPECIES: CoA-acylating methylmalonate-semialdehyde dehydrogenase [Aeromicrobium]|uniref:CoA-acylating methylmalonate-semialdehyde dehydrogenase n=1 Tax=Aeromicrobium TaxID=2040 RepID=UPI000700457E|nr:MULTISPECIES: CoA-acylating methylmalonate-semialdehyde dehydrogenase [Aeromicrobium]KQX72603.1 methylmalonate-semialdehyde dehydrogenase [Aeromicrobium sp. Root472D3]MBD8607649.1 CoA-acylating methylmalonate-semialdehyde dehydrogenase [Aeromicrobium sp. CFBP 8757]MCL8252247.1 CoA-acylating methylmalonate-semialdehyde dehydrogenase [Aeromicrobium fastidiosum]